MTPSRDVLRARAASLRDARRLARAGDHAAASAVFRRLLEAQGASPALRCEAGFVAFRGGDVATADQLTSQALHGWADPPPRAQRVSRAMCHYNRALVLRATGHDDAARRELEASLRLRPNSTVSRMLGELAAPAPAPAEERDDEDEVTILFGGRPVRVLQQTAHPRDPQVSLRMLQADDSDADVVEEDDGMRCTTTAIVVLRAGTAMVLDSVEECLFNSFLDDHIELSTPEWVELGNGIGVRFETRISGRGEAEVGFVASRSQTLTLCASREGAWECQSWTTVDASETDCDNSGGCRGDENDPELPRETYAGYAVDAAIEGTTLRFTRSDDRDTYPDAPDLPATVDLRALFGPASDGAGPLEPSRP